MDDALFRALAAAGGRAFLVGGAARDLVLSGEPPKDLDIEVFGLSPDAVRSTLERFGKVDAVGASFGVYKLRTPDGEVDVSLPRRENKAGRGHKGFIVAPDPTMTPEQAAARRDFTVNALMLDPLTGEVLDFFGGRADWQARVLRHVGPAFAEDPLRVLRAMQFCARWGFTLESQTAVLCRTLSGEFDTLPKERVWGEWRKWGERGRFPSAGLRALEDAGWVMFLGVSDLPSSTLEYCDRVASVADVEGIKGEARVTLLLAALSTLSAAEETTKFLAAIGAPSRVARGVKSLLEARWAWKDPGSTARALAFQLGQSSRTLREFGAMLDEEERKALYLLAQHLGVLDAPPQPILRGDHLIERGWQQGPQLGRALQDAFQAQLRGAFSDLAGALTWVARHHPLRSE
jgi:tRNA nucleotidyltransferase (CCA-adding enzyme)